jgi:hypothetical protein
VTLPYYHNLLLSLSIFRETVVENCRTVDEILGIAANLFLSDTSSLITVLSFPGRY